MLKFPASAIDSCWEKIDIFFTDRKKEEQTDTGVKEYTPSPSERVYNSCRSHWEGLHHILK